MSDVSPSKLTEFATVLVCGVLVGLGVTLAVLELEKLERDITLVALGILSILAWQVLRGRFGRNK